MTRDQFREALEMRQVATYFAAVLLGVVTALVLPGTTALEPAINPALALMLFVTFLQVPLAALGQAMRDVRFLGALLGVNFIVVPLLVAGLVPFMPSDPMIRLGILLVLLCPCIDYVVTFAHLGRADARLLLASTPALLIVQMLLLPIYLAAFLGDDAARLVRAGPFVHAFVWLIAIRSRSPPGFRCGRHAAARENARAPRLASFPSRQPRWCCSSSSRRSCPSSSRCSG